MMKGLRTLYRKLLKFKVVPLILIMISLLLCISVSIKAQESAPASTSHPTPILKKTKFFSQNEKNTAHIDGTIEKAPIKNVLRQLSTVTGWRIFMEPGLSYTVDSKFKNLPPHEALPLIFGTRNYALVSDGKNGQRLLVFVKNQDAATESIRPDLSEPIPNELILILKKGSKLTPQEIAQLIGGKILAISKSGNAIRFSFEDKEAVAKAKEILAKLIESNTIDSIQNNYYMISPEAALGVVASGLKIPREVTLTPGTGTTIAMIDSAPHTEDVYYSDVLMDPVYFIDPKNAPLSSDPTHADSLLGSSLYWLHNSGYDSLDFNYLPLVVLDSSGNGDSFSVAEAVLYADAAGVDVINLSLSGDGYSPYLADAIRTAINNGKIVTAAAGNEPTGQVTYPAGYEGVIGVTALENGQIASYANQGNFVDAAVAGTGLFYFDESWFLSTGTSISTIYLSSMVAAEMSAGGKTAEQALSSILSKFGYKK